MGRRRSVLPLLIAVAVVVLIVGAAVLLFDKASTNSQEMDPKTYYGLTSDDEAALVVNDVLLETRGVVREGSIYIDYPTVWSNLNGNFYWEPDTQMMLLTLPEGTVSWKMGENDGSLIEINGMPYLSAACVKAYSDIDMNIYDDPQRIVARTVWDNVAAERVTADAAVRNRADKKGEVLTYVSEGDIVTMVENAGSWCKVGTQDGYSGYLAREEIEAAPEGSIRHVSDEKFVFEHILSEEPICMAWQYMESREDKELQGLISRTSGLNVISPTWFRFTSVKGDLDSLASKEYVDQAHNKGIQKKHPNSLMKAKPKSRSMSS